ncbi:AraC family transcriptional regulator [Flavivirga aquimarina]|uniref:AraC family transcriptional regulator n=1 Tax=Flavivirga aquimarina TaxID=2027862 RepID=A0ABT8W5J1_9FLAO|nr:helix-turn-helix domain-containing protein [Flavivirga aquimarina]MDO5968384.1 AraC family transcriptional regulator [Flavivirga aquimarina]
MTDEVINEKRIKQIHNMLMEFASGNFSYKIERSNMNDGIEALIALVNMSLEEIRGSFLHQGYTNLTETYKHMVQMFFVLDPEDVIITYNSRIKQMLLFNDDELQKNTFSTFLTQDSKLAWKDLKTKLEHSNQDTLEKSIELYFKSKQDLIVPTNCLVSKYIDRINQSERIIITSIEIIKSSMERKNELQEIVNSRKNKEKTTGNSTGKKVQLNLSYLDIRKIREVHDYIINNLDKPLSPLIELAHTFGTNEYKLKYGFKQLYGQTIFRFLIDQRLRKASVLIQHTDTSIKEVAHVTGFISAPHFSKVFKEKYGFSPRDLRKQSNFHQNQ